jgi:molybdenum-dependent DNA-binding transcriptional regulator ModE
VLGRHVLEAHAGAAQQHHRAFTEPVVSAAPGGVRAVGASLTVFAAELLGLVPSPICFPILA